MSGAAAWAAWFALALSLLLLATVAGVVVLVLRFWRKVEPTVAPMLMMFGGPTHTSTSAAPAPSTAALLEQLSSDDDPGAHPFKPAPAEPRPCLEDSPAGAVCTFPLNHGGPHEWEPRP